MEKRKILVAEDDRLVLATLTEGLARAGFEVEAVDNGREAVASVAAADFDLAILDVRMPEMSGLEVAHEIRDRCPTLILSAYSEAEVVKEAIRQGAVGYLVKPVDVTQLIPAVEAALARGADLRRLAATEHHLSHALNQGREISVAVGLVMERHAMSQKDAFEALRRQARSCRVKLTEVAEQMVAAAETVNAFGCKERAKA